MAAAKTRSKRQSKKVAKTAKKKTAKKAAAKRVSNRAKPKYSLSTTVSGIPTAQLKVELDKLQKTLRRQKYVFEYSIVANALYFYTNAFHIFEFNEYNRPIRTDLHLDESVARHGADSGFPVRVLAYLDEQGSLKFEVTHGNHRFFTVKAADVPCYFAVGSTDIGLYLSEVSTKSWSLHDFLESRAGAGEVGCVMALAYKNKTGFTDACACDILMGTIPAGGGISDRVKRGDYQIFPQYEQFAETIAVLSAIFKKAGRSFYRSRNFVSALSKVCYCKAVDLEHFANQALKYRKLQKVGLRSSVLDYIDMLGMIYNRNASSSKQMTQFLGSVSGGYEAYARTPNKIKPQVLQQHQIDDLYTKV